MFDLHNNASTILSSGLSKSHFFILILEALNDNSGLSDEVVIHMEDLDDSTKG